MKRVDGQRVIKALLNSIETIIFYGQGVMKRQKWALERLSELRIYKAWSNA